MPLSTTLRGEFGFDYPVDYRSTFGSLDVRGVVPTLIYYGVQIIHPQFFLVSCCVICAVVSVMTVARGLPLRPSVLP